MPVLELEEAACKSRDYDGGSHGELPHQAGVLEYPVHIYPLTHTVLLEGPTPNFFGVERIHGHSIRTHNQGFTPPFFLAHLEVESLLDCLNFTRK